MRRKAFSKNDGIEEGLINLTPLIDVVFVVLIVFILVAPLVQLDQIQLASSNNTKKESLQKDEKIPIVIHVYENNQICLNQKKVDNTELQTLLTKLYNECPGITPRLFHDKKAAFGTYQTIKNAVENAGFEKLDVVLQPN